MTISIQQLLASSHEAFLFDLDGTLVDTMPLHYSAYASVLGDIGLDLPESVYMGLVGAPAREAIPQFLGACGRTVVAEHEVARIHADKKRLFSRMLADRPPVRLSSADILEKAQGIKRCALVSSGNREGVHAIVSAMGWEHAFGAIVTGDDVARGKPYPDPFTKAADALGVTPGACLVFEDTADGLASARAAGMEAIDVTQVRFT